MPLCRRPNAQGDVFFGPTFVMVTELLKVAISVFCLLYAAIIRQRHGLKNYSIIREDIRHDEDVDEKLLNSERPSEEEERPLLVSKSIYHELRDEILNIRNLRLILPATLFVMQNNLQVIAASHLDSTQFQLLSQLKLVTTALCATLILKTKLAPKQWGCIALLLLGLAVVQLAPGVAVKGTNSLHLTSVPGIAAMTAACCFSGLASTLTESVLKQSTTSFWAANLHLAFYSLLPAFIPVFTDSVAKNSFVPFRHFNLLVWAAILLNAIGGLLVAMVMKYADNILKGFAVSAALLATVFATSYMDGQQVNLSHLLGACLVIASMLSFGRAAQRRATPLAEDDKL